MFYLYLDRFKYINISYFISLNIEQILNKFPTDKDGDSLHIRD